MNKNSGPIQCDKIEQLAHDLSQEKSGCPYTAFISSMNKLSGYATTDRLPQVKKAIKQLVDLLFYKKKIPEQEAVYPTITNGLSRANSIKLTKHIFDVMYLQEELYPLIHRALSKIVPYEPLRSDATRLNLQNDDIRKMWGMKFANIFGEHIENVIHVRERNKVNDISYRRALDFAVQHSRLYANEENSFGMMFTGGILDAHKNIRSLIEHIPQLFHKKYNKLPDKNEYRAIVEANLKGVIIPLASTNLNNLTTLVRPKERVESNEIIINYDNQNIFVDGLAGFNAMDVCVENFTLDENEMLHATEHFLKERAERMIGVADDMETVYYARQDLFTSGFYITTGCPALAADAKNGKKVIEQFCDDLLALLDAVYFPFRDKRGV